MDEADISSDHVGWKPISSIMSILVAYLDFLALTFLRRASCPQAVVGPALNVLCLKSKRHAFQAMSLIFTWLLLWVATLAQVLSSL